MTLQSDLLALLPLMENLKAQWLDDAEQRQKRADRLDDEGDAADAQFQYGMAECLDRCAGDLANIIAAMTHTQENGNARD